MNQLLETPCDEAAQPVRNQSNQPHRILVAEDDHELRLINTMVLTCAGYAVDNAENGAAAWEALYAKRYDLLITDNHMPRLPGIELLKKLRSAHMELPVIMATGTIPTQELAQNLWLQPVTTVEKPYTIDQLLDTVRVVLRTTDSGPGNSSHGQTDEASHRPGVRLTFPQPGH
ncbi:MAG: response regulator [Verrucomicrobiota bacterium]|jgi:two-component system OmpR family response regulator